MTNTNTLSAWQDTDPLHRLLSKCTATLLREINYPGKDGTRTEAYPDMLESPIHPNEGHWLAIAGLLQQSPASQNPETPG